MGCHSSSLASVEIVSHRAIALVEPCAPTPAVDCPSFGNSGEPGARVLRHARLWPLSQRVDQSLLCEVFGEADVSGHLGECRDDARAFDAPDGVDRSLGCRT